MKEFEKFTSLGRDCINTKSEIFDSCNFKDCDFSGALFSGCFFENCTFENCNLSNVKIHQSKFFDTTFTDCKLIGIIWPQSDIPSSFSAHKCSFQLNVFSGYNLDSFSFHECSFKEAFFQDCSARKCDFSGSDFSEARFENCNLEKAVFYRCSNLFMDPESNNVVGAKVPTIAALSMLQRYKLKIAD